MKSRQHLASWLMAAALLGAGASMSPVHAQAASEPTLNQIYEAAQSGQLDKAQTMMQQVLVAHPNSAKAHFVQAELSARQGKLERAREELATAEKIAPGLPFAKPEAVQHLRAQLSGQAGSASGNALTTTPTRVAPAAVQTPAAPAASSFPWGIVLALGGAVIALLIVLSRKKAAAPVPSYGSGNVSGGSGLSGPQGFGMGNQPMNPGMNNGMGYGQQPAASGMGSRIAGGLATGLAVGAGMMAANAIGKTLMGNDEPRHDNSGSNNNSYNSVDQGGQNADMGGQDFGVQDGGSWDDAGGGGDWDN